MVPDVEPCSWSMLSSLVGMEIKASDTSAPAARLPACLRPEQNKMASARDHFSNTHECYAARGRGDSERDRERQTQDCFRHLRPLSHWLVILMV